MSLMSCALPSPPSKDIPRRCWPTRNRRPKCSLPSLEVILKNTNHMVKIVDDLLQLARIEAAPGGLQTRSGEPDGGPDGGMEGLPSPSSSQAG